MKTYKIKKGKHYSNWLNLPIPHIRKNRTTAYKFIIEADNFNSPELQDDWNKLFGIGIGYNARQNSVRAAWRFNKDKSTFEWCIFREIKGQFFFSKHLEGATCAVFYNREKALFEIQVNDEKYTYDLNTFDYDHDLINANWLLELQPYFGGNATADADYTITRQNINI